MALTFFLSNNNLKLTDMITRSDLEIQRVIKHINEMRMSKNYKKLKEEVRQGLREALRVLCEKDESLEHIAANCSSVRARCIAWLAIDYLQGKCESKVLLLVGRAKK